MTEQKKQCSRGRNVRNESSQAVYLWNPFIAIPPDAAICKGNWGAVV